MEDFFARVETIQRHWDVLRHPFYERWSNGELTPGELAFYAGQYRHAVIALADATCQVGEPGHAEVEREHVGVWDCFCRAVGGDTAAAPTPETAACVAAWSDPHRDATGTLAALYAIESSQPTISQTKRHGLIQHYGAAANSDATRYFDVHAVLDHEHAAQDRLRLVQVMRPADEDRLLAEAERVLTANWWLLDGVDAHGAVLNTDAASA
jgi:pyrroloquinoline-quinone synthase